MNNKAFTLIEMLVVLAIAGILTSISVGSFLSWKNKASIENDVKKMSGFIQKLRIKAFAQKTFFTCSFATNGKIFYATRSSDSSVIRTKLKNGFKFNGNNLVIDSRGTMSGASIKPLDTDTGAAYDCLAITDTRIKIGKWDASNGKCTVK